jgi:hypothetical protein
MKQKPQTVSHAVAGLIQKRAELSGKIEDLLGEARAIKVDIEALDRAIYLLDPEFDVSTVKSKRKHTMNSFFKHGQMSTRVIDIVREHGPLNTHQIAEALAKVSGIDLEAVDKDAFKTSLSSVLYRIRKDGIFVNKGRGAANVLIWAVAD